MKMLKNMFRAFLYFSANSTYEMKPHHVFLFFVVVLSIAFLFKKSSYLLNFLSYNNDAHFSERLDIQPNPDSSEIEVDSVFFVNELPDSNIAKFTGHESDLGDSVVMSEFISYAENDTLHFQHALHAFFNQLKFASDSVVRIVYYGDSQIEGDRIVHPLREVFQQRFGGKGIGYMPAEMYFNTSENYAIITKHFDKHIVAYTSNFFTSNFGLYGRYFSPIKLDAQIRINNRNNSKNFDVFKVLYAGKAGLKLDADKNWCFEEDLNSSEFACKSYLFDEAPSTLRLNFTGADSFCLFGFLFDPLSGITVDHVPFRGNANLMLNRFDAESFIEMGKLLKPSLIILHFGLNVVPDIRENYKSYQKALERDIILLKKFLPNVSVLLVGVSDMARSVNGQLEPYPNIDAIVDAQRLAATNTGAYFYDLREHMGGKGAVIEWVERGLAKSDYAHFTLEGSQLVGQGIADTLLTMYNEYLQAND